MSRLMRWLIAAPLFGAAVVLGLWGLLLVVGGGTSARIAGGIAIAVAPILIVVCVRIVSRVDE